MSFLAEEGLGTSIRGALVVSPGIRKMGFCVGRFAGLGRVIGRFAFCKLWGWGGVQFVRVKGCDVWGVGRMWIWFFS